MKSENEASKKLNEHLKEIHEYAVKNFTEENNYSLYVNALNKAVSLGYNSTIICPILNGEPKPWADFHTVLVNEIVRFTNFADTPACIISGGSLNCSAQRNEEFAFHALDNLRPEFEVAFLTISLNRDFGIIGNNETLDLIGREKWFEALRQKEILSFFDEPQLKFKNHCKLNKELDLRIFLMAEN